MVYVGVFPPNNVRATAISTASIEVTWEPSPPSGDVTATGYFISYTTTDPFASHGNLTVTGGSATRDTLTNLEEGTLYTITVQATTSDNRMSANSNEVSVKTYTDGK